MERDNAPGAVNQQERLDAYLAGFVDGEGSFHVAVYRNSNMRIGWQLVPEFHISQCPERRQVLDLLQRRLGCGRIQENHRGSRDTTLVLVVRQRQALLERVIPFFEAQPLLSSKQQELLTFAFIVRAMHAGKHLHISGFEALRTRALATAGDGIEECIVGNVENLQRPYAEHFSWRGSEEMVRPAWRHAEPSRNDLAPCTTSGRGGVTRVSVPIHCGRRRLEGSCP